MISLTMLLVALSGTNSSATEPFPVPITIKAGVPAPMSGELFPDAEARKLFLLLTERRLRAEIAEAEILALREAVKVAEGRIRVLDATIAEGVADLEIEKASCPGWFEQHVGFCGGLYGGYSLSEKTVDAGLGVVYGFKW